MRGSLLLAALLLAWPAHAQQVYRCGNVYQQAPCAGGRAVDVSDTRSDEDRKAAAAVAKGNAKLAAEMERERRAREAKIRPAAATGIGARTQDAQRAAPATMGKKPRVSARLREETEFQATEPVARSRKERPVRPGKPASASQP